jgi:hypothetical protein
LRPSNLLSTGYYAVWSLLLLGFVAFGWRSVWNEVHNLAPLQPTPYASTDAFLSLLLRVKNGSERIRLAIDQLPADQPVIFVCPANDDRWDFVCDTVSYLTWPHQIRKMEVDPRQVGNGRTVAAKSAGVAAIFCDIALPSRYQARFRVGPHLIIASPVQEKE